MRYHYTKPENFICDAASEYSCDHPLYSACTLYKIDDLGLAIIQQRFNRKLKIWWWGPIDRWLVNDIFYRPGFNEYFNNDAGSCKDDLYPTVNVRQIMWALKMKPMPREYWEIRR